MRGVARDILVGTLRRLALFLVVTAALCPTALAARRAAAFTVDGHPVRWEAHERWPRSVLLTVKPLVNGETTDYRRISSCAYYAYWRGVALRVTTCGNPMRLVVKAASVDRRRVKIVYSW